MTQTEIKMRMEQLSMLKAGDEVVIDKDGFRKYCLRYGGWGDIDEREVKETARFVEHVDCGSVNVSFEGNTVFKKMVIPNDYVRRVYAIPEKMWEKFFDAPILHDEDCWGGKYKTYGEMWTGEGYKKG